MVPSLFFSLQVLSHELSDDFVFVTNFGFQVAEFFGSLRGLGPTRPVEDAHGILKEQGLPLIELAGGNAIFIADFRDRSVFDEMEFEDLGLFSSAEAPPLCFLGRFLQGSGW